MDLYHIARQRNLIVMIACDDEDGDEIDAVNDDDVDDEDGDDLHL